MKENFDPHQVVISREYFDTLVEMARRSDTAADRKDHPNQTILGRILWHARKFNARLRQERQVELATDLACKRLRRHKRMAILMEYLPDQKVLHVHHDGHTWPALVVAEDHQDKECIRVICSEPLKYHQFETYSVHIDQVYPTLPPNLWSMGT